MLIDTQRLLIIGQQDRKWCVWTKSGYFVSDCGMVGENDVTSGPNVAVTLSSALMFGFNIQSLTINKA
eukprot:5250546-Ditylum_brightwellii.AAC.1